MTYETAPLVKSISKGVSFDKDKRFFKTLAEMLGATFFNNLAARGRTFSDPS